MISNDGRCKGTRWLFCASPSANKRLLAPFRRYCGQDRRDEINTAILNLIDPIIPPLWRDVPKGMPYVARSRTCRSALPLDCVPRFRTIVLRGYSISAPFVAARQSGLSRQWAGG